MNWMKISIWSNAVMTIYVMSSIIYSYHFVGMVNSFWAYSMFGWIICNALNNISLIMLKRYEK